MKEIIEEYGSTIAVCIIGVIVLAGLGYFINHTGILSKLASAYADYFYGQSI